MKVARLHGRGEIRIHEESAPVPAPDEALVQVSAVGICGSDLHWFASAGIGDARLDQPLVLGHEFSGVTQDGRRVAVDPAIPCGRCARCLEGNPNLCSSLRFAGHGRVDGSLRQSIAWPERCLVPLPDALSEEDGALLEPLGVALHAVDLAKVRPGMRVGVFGCGTIGLLVIQVARLAGALEVYVTEPLPHRLGVAFTLGAQAWVPGSEVDVAIECAGVNAAVEDALAAVRPGGRVVLVGIPDDDRISFSASLARRKGLTVKLARRMKFTYQRAIRMVERGQVDLRPLVTHRFPLEQAAEAFRVASRREGVKVIIQPNQE